jgi:hypothetical protein
MSAPPSPVAAFAPAALPTPPPPVTGKGQHQFVVRYYRRMRVHQVHRVVVELRSTSRKTGPTAMTPADPVTVRLQIPGSFVTPAEQQVFARATGNKAVFTVTPLGTGRLRDGKATITHQGTVLQEIPLPSKAVTQQLTGLLLLLAVALPCFLYIYTMKIDLSTPPPDLQALARRYAPVAEGDALPADESQTSSKERGSIARFIVDNIPDYDGYVRQGAVAVQRGYDSLHEQAHTRQYFFTYVVGALLALTLLSAVLHRAARGKRKGMPLTLPHSTAGF